MITAQSFSSAHLTELNVRIKKSNFGFLACQIPNTRLNCACVRIANRLLNLQRSKSESVYLYALPQQYPRLSQPEYFQCCVKKNNFKSGTNLLLLIFDFMSENTSIAILFTTFSNVQQIIKLNLSLHCTAFETFNASYTTLDFQCSERS